MKPIKNFRGFVQSLYRSNLFGKIEVRDGVVFARRCRDYFVTCDIACVTLGKIFSLTSPPLRRLPVISWIIESKK